MRAIALIAAALVALGGWAADLPQMSFINENSLLESFPLDKATREQVLDAYGPPQKQLTGLPLNGEAWIYSKGKDSKEFQFVFRGDLVHDVIVRYPGAGFLASDRSARKIQGSK
jgi:hypothetical protein